MVKKRMSSQKGSSTNRREAGEIERNTTETAPKGKLAYEIRLKNHLEPHWAEWFEGWTITNIENDEVILSCASTDHAGLHGVLDKIRDLHLTLISVKQISMDAPEP